MYDYENGVITEAHRGSRTSPQAAELSYLCITLTCNDTIRNPSYRGCMLNKYSRVRVVSSNADALFSVLGFDRLSYLLDSSSFNLVNANAGPRVFFFFSFFVLFRA